jgi:hypothetical protein
LRQVVRQPARLVQDVAVEGVLEGELVAGLGDGTGVGEQARERGGASFQRLTVASLKASRSALSTSSVPTTLPVAGSTIGTIASDSVLAKAVR